MPDTAILARSTELRVEGVSKRYGSVSALDDLSLTVEPGRFQALLGPSGSGKTSLLMAVAGFLRLDRGRIVVNGRDVSELPPERRNFGMVFQGYALFPHLTVIDNVAFALRARNVPRGERHRRAAQAIAMVRLDGLEDRLPRQLSGGQQQRVALARAIAFAPDLLLLDEPLSALDRALRSELQSELRDLQRRTGLTCLYVTHDQDEAMSMADSVAVLTGGRIVQIGAPADLYERPQSRFVASFLGKSNFLTVTVTDRDGACAVCRSGGTTLRHRGGDAAVLALRPEKLLLVSAAFAMEGYNMVAATVVEVTYLGNAIEIVAQSGDLGPLIVRAPASAASLAQRGSGVWLAWPWDATVAIEQDGALP